MHTYQTHLLKLNFPVINNSDN